MPTVEGEAGEEQAAVRWTEGKGRLGCMHASFCLLAMRMGYIHSLEEGARAAVKGAWLRRRCRMRSSVLATAARTMYSLKATV